MSDFTHLNKDNSVSMVDVGNKTPTHRFAKASVRVRFPSFLAEKLNQDGFTTPKGPVFEVARIAGIMAAKKTGDLIPLCHPIGIDSVEIDIKLIDDHALVICSASVFAKTGIEMEALTGASVAALTIYDMCKALTQDIHITDLMLMEKTGGKNDFKREA